MDLNSSLGNSTTADSLAAVPGLIAFSVIMFVGVIAPLAVLDTLILVAFCIDRHSPIQIRLVLGNFMLMALVTLVFLTLEHLSVLVLATTDLPVLPQQFCAFLSWALLSANSVRILLTTAFSVVLFIMIVKGVKAVNKIALLVFQIILCMGGFFTLTLPILIFTSSHFYAAQVACTPTEFGEDTANRIVAGFYVTGLKVIPIVTTISMTIACGVYLRKHRISGSVRKDFFTAMVKLTGFLILGSFISFCGHTLPIFIGKVFPAASEVVSFYIFFTVYNLSLWPTPVLIMAYMGKSFTFKKCPLVPKNKIEPSSSKV